MKAKNSAIGCRVTSCRHNAEGCNCELDHIEVAPCCDCSSGRPEDESMCASYRCKNC